MSNFFTPFRTPLIITKWLTLVCLTVLSLMLVHLPASAQTATAPLTLSNGVAVGPLSDARLGQQYFVFNVPVGTTKAEFSIAGGPGDADIYVRRGSVPTTTTWTYRPYLSSSNETVTVNNPQSGNWYVMVRGYSSYSGVMLKAKHNAPNMSLVSTPSFTPLAGTYTGQVNVSLAVSTPANATIRFTTDGSIPTEASEIYVAPIMMTRTGTIKAVAFAQGYAPSALASSSYTINSVITTLSSGTAINNLAGATSSVANYRISVPAGASSLNIALSGGTGDADLYVKYGQLATTSAFDLRPNIRGNAESVSINTPQAGDYFVMVYGYQAYASVSLKATVVTGSMVGKPDLMIPAEALNPRVSTETFATNSCDVLEGAITAGTKRLLRFTTQSRNIGTADLVLGNPANNAAFEFGSCHGHYHFRSFAEYRLLNTAGQVVRTGRKVGFCLMDITRIDPAANPSARYNCSNQGIQAGWADVYSSNLSGQWIDITGLAAGVYILEITMDPMNVIDESDETNNVTRANVTIP